MTQPDSASAPVLRDPAPLLERVRAQWAHQRAPGGRHPDLWIFGYASLIWRTEFEAAEHHRTRVHGWHRALKMWSRINRGTPQQPGLVFALLPGGCCSGLVYRVPHRQADAALAALWAREMPTGVYDPRWLPCRTPAGPVRALAFTLDRASPAHTGVIPDGEMLEILRHARGRYGSTLDYLLETAACLRERGIRDREIERLERLARRIAAAR